ncbi:MAG: two-component system response regulator [Fibrobacterota bacterium]|nr:two-component system response regulator [Fibrobacterota bacterium]QQS07245.1 MAG: two-component system response regulator [Fibrobacterota bacterium]
MLGGNILLLGDDFRSNAKLALSLSRRGWETPPTPASWETIPTTPTHALVNMREDAITCLDLLTQLRKSFPACRLVVVAGWASIGAALEAARRGASDLLTKPVSIDQVEASLAGRELALDASVPSLEKVEWEHIQRILLQTGGNVSRTARLLGIDRRTLQRKLARHPPGR